MATPEILGETASVAQQSPTYVVGIGASAGGLEALERLFEKMPANTGMAFVVVQHLSPDFKSLMDELLSRRTRLPVHRVEDGILIEPNSIYLIPPRREMIIVDGRLLLTEVDPHQGLSLPIDYFFRSLAQSCGRNAIAIVLSGTGSDGSRGIRDVHAAGGLVIAQTGRTAKFDGMPGTARETGVVDLSLDPEDIPTALVQYGVRHDIHDLATQFDSLPADEEGLAAILRLLRDRHGIDFSFYKLNTVVRRTERRLQVNRIDALKDYLQRLDHDPAELNALYHDLLVGVTRFFRDEEAFQRLGQELDNSLRLHPVEQEFRAWVAGCATGEEAYSLAILLDERIRASGRDIKARVFATDVHQASLDHAGCGLYDKDRIGSVSEERLQTYFTQTDRGYLVNPSIRQMVVFAEHNVIKDAPFTRMSLVSCRNLLIYLQPGAQKKALSLFHFGLKPKGILFLGPSESPGELEDEFEPMDRHWNLYRKRRDVRMNFELRPIMSSAGRSLRPSGLPELVNPVSRGIDLRLAGAYDTLLSEFMPPSLLIDASHLLMHIFGDGGKYLRHPNGRITRDVLDCMEGSLKLAVAGSVRRAQSTQQPVLMRGIDANGELIDLCVRPIRSALTEDVDYLVSFSTSSEQKSSIADGTDTWIDLQQISGHEMDALESELRRAKEKTQALIEELETSNEDLQAANEELVASNEELQSTNEELHSVNEELHTVNAEHQRKIQQLTVLTDDMENLLLSTQVHTLFLDQQLRVRRFTPGIGDIFSLVSHDIGRSIESFHHRLNYATLVADMRSVMETGERHETEVQDADDRWLLLRILPYLTENGNEGVILTLTDIDVTRRAQMNLNRVVDFFPHAVVAINEEGVIEMVNRQTQSIFGYEADEMLGQPVEMLLPERLRDDHCVNRKMYAQNPVPREMDRLGELYALRKCGEEFPVEVGLSSINTEKGLLMMACINDVTSRVLTRRELCRREKELRMVINCVPMLIAYIDSNRVYRYVNDYYCEKLGLSVENVTGRKVQEVIGEEAWSQKQSHLDRVFAGESVTAELRRVFPTDPSGHAAWIQSHYVPDHDDNGLVRGCFVAMSDITELKDLLAVRERQVEQRDLFLATLAHELRNPLGAVTSALKLLQKRSQDAETLKTTLAAIDRQSTQMSALLDDLLDVARVTKGKIELRRAAVCLNDIVRESVESVMPSFDKRKQIVQIGVGKERVWVYGDAVRLRQVVSNLLTNASRYSPIGESISVSMGVENTNSADGKRMAAICVVDRGIGIDPAVQEQIFEPFAQLKRTHKEASEGLGLGLSLSRRLAQLHGGNVTVFSEGDGRGSSFTVHLPVIEPPQAECRAGASAPVCRASDALSVVIVEDNDDARELLRQLLELEKINVLAAGDGPTGLELILQRCPHVAMIDVGLPGMNGHEVAREVRRAGLTTILIAVTGYGQDSDRKAALAAGFDEHLTKPLKFDQLLKKLERYLIRDEK